MEKVSKCPLLTPFPVKQFPMFEIIGLGWPESCTFPVDCPRCPLPVPLAPEAVNEIVTPEGTVPWEISATIDLEFRVLDSEEE